MSDEYKRFLFPQDSNHPLLKMELTDVVPLIHLFQLHRYGQFPLDDLDWSWCWYFLARLHKEHGFVPDTFLDNIPESPSGAMALIDAHETWVECVKGTVNGTNPPAF
jgi:hypothetical protein